MNKISLYEHIRFVQRLLSRVTVEIIKRINNHDQSELISKKDSEYKKMLNRYYPDYHENKIKDMNLIDLIEMSCELFSNGEYTEKEIDKHQKTFGYSDELKKILLNTMDFFKK